MEPGETNRGPNPPPKLKMGEKQQNHRMPLLPTLESDADGHAKMETEMFDLNMNPSRIHEQASNNQVRVHRKKFFFWLVWKFYSGKSIFYINGMLQILAN